MGGEVEESLSEEINSRLVRSAEAGLVRKRGPSKGTRKAGKPRSSKGVKKAKSKAGRRKPVRKVGSATKSKAGRRKSVKSKSGRKSPSKSKSGRKSPSKSKSVRKSPSKSKSGKSKAGRRKSVRKTGTAAKSKSGRRKQGSGKKGTRTMKSPESGSRSSGRSVSDKCFESAMRSMKMWKDIAANFERQKTRITRQLSTSNSKNSKKEEFESVFHKLVSVGGGDKNNLSCSGSTTNAGAAQLTNLTTVLSACETEVEAVCNTTEWTGLANETILTECEALMDTFKMEAQVCLELSVGPNATDTETACDCWHSIVPTREAIKHCKFPAEAKAVADNLQICLAKFGECRKHEDDAAIAISACGTSFSALTEEASKLTANSDAVTQAQAAVATLAGSSRVRRSEVTGTALSSCTEVSTVSTQMLALVLSFPTSPDIIVLSANVVASTTVTCTEEEMTALAALSTSFEEAVFHLADAIHAIQEQLHTLTGTTASAETIELGGGTATARMF